MKQIILNAAALKNAVVLMAQRVVASAGAGCAPSPGHRF